MKPSYQEHEGHRIEIRERRGTFELLIDDAPVPYGRFPTGEFFLNDYAYDWQDDLLELARRYVSYRRRVAAIQAGKREKGQ
jgi:hypothetical protein